MERPASAIHDLDGLRGLAILLVLLRHAARSMGYDTTYPPTLPLGSWDFVIPCLNGWAGVDLFFVLSGFLIAHHVIRSQSRNWSLRRYLAKRILRIVPAYYATLAVVVIGLPFFTIDRENLALRTGYHLLFLQDYLIPNIISAFWSLGVEEKFYLLLPLVLLPVLRLSHFKSRLACLVGLYCLPVLLRAATFVSLPEVDHLQYFLHLRSPFHVTADGLFMGCLVALIYQSREELPMLQSRRLQHGLFWTGSLLSCGLLFGGLIFGAFTFTRVVFAPCALDTGFGLVMLGLLLLGPSPYSRFFSSWPLFFFCKLSYSLYLVHMIFMRAGVEWLWPLYSPGPFKPSGGFFVLFVPFFIGLSVLAALLLHYLVEKPFLLLKDGIKA